LVFHAGTAVLPDGRFMTAGGRILTVVGEGADLAAARRHAERAAAQVGFTGMQRRADIAALVTPSAAGIVSQATAR
jgi:phosphoribosylamine--glycine ligase